MVEGLLLALADIDQVIRVIRASRDQEEAKQGLDADRSPGCHAATRARARTASASSRSERGRADVYRLTAVQADAILKMTLGQLVNLEQEKLSEEHAKLLEQIREFMRILSDEANILAMIKEESLELKKKHGDNRRTEITRRGNR